MELELTPEQQSAVARIIALRRIAHETPNKTTYAQSRILRSLNPRDLAQVALALSNHSDRWGW